MNKVKATELRKKWRRVGIKALRRENGEYIVRLAQYHEMRIARLYGHGHLRRAIRNAYK